MSGSPLEHGPEELAAAGAGLSLQIGEDRVAIIEFDQPGLEHNRFTPELLERMGSLLEHIKSEASRGQVVGVVLTSDKPESFIVGVDVAAIAAVGSAEEGAAAARQGQQVFRQLADLPVPTVAAINGTCLGGATEMALACDWRIASDSRAVKIGLPEVNLGIFPGFGGSQRLPRRISLERALQMILAGRSVDARRARRIGLVDAVVPAPLLLREARRWVLDQGAAGQRAPEDRPWLRRLRRFVLEGQPLGRWLLFRQAAKGVRAKTGGHYPAPLAALDTVRRGLRLPLQKALQLEAERVGQLIVSPVARNLIGIFFLRQRARRRARTGVSETPLRRIEKLAVVGAGVMGGGIAQLAAYRGLPVRLKDIDRHSLSTGNAVAYKRFEERRRSGRLSRRGVVQGMGRISPTLEYTGFRQADLVIEAVVERLDVKQQVLAEMEAACRADAVLATNTSSFTLRALGEALQDPGRLVGLHFFNPVHRMPLVEVVRGPHSHPQAVDAAAAFALDLGKVPVVVGDAPGFFVNRVLMPYLNEALLLLESGVSIERVDGVLVRFGMPMGPLRLLDEIGLDIAADVAAELGPAFGDRIPASQVSERMREAGRLGRKVGKGFYVYGEKGAPRPDGGLAGLLPGAGAKMRIATEEIIDRCLLLLLNEACRTLNEEIVVSPQEADLALVLGTGFAPFRGGIFRYADERGLSEVRDRLAELAEHHGGRFEAAPLLAERAAASASFYAAQWPVQGG
ncbi:MAG: 3-hydroxyacyl-CoA dehydrogenase NAD-binding domain-containing protein [Acidobacteriota bacterium]